MATAGLRTEDKLIIAMILFFTSIAFSVEFYWLIFNQVMESRDDVLARLIAVYWPADHSWRIAGHPPEKALNLTLEGVNVMITPWLSLILIVAILKGWACRYPLQLLIGAYTAYGTLVYFGVAHFSGYAVFDVWGRYPLVLLYLVNMPWLLIYSWFVWDAFREIVKRMAATELK